MDSVVLNTVKRSLGCTEDGTCESNIVPTVEVAVVQSPDCFEPPTYVDSVCALVSIFVNLSSNEYFNIDDVRSKTKDDIAKLASSDEFGNAIVDTSDTYCESNAIELNLELTYEIEYTTTCIEEYLNTVTFDTVQQSLLACTEGNICDFNIVPSVNVNITTFDCPDNAEYENSTCSLVEIATTLTSDIYFDVEKIRVSVQRSIIDLTKTVEFGNALVDSSRCEANDLPLQRALLRKRR